MLKEVDQSFPNYQDPPRQHRIFSASHAAPFLKSNTDKFNIKNVAMTSIYNSIKKVDVSKMVGPQINANLMLPQIKTSNNELGFLDEKLDIHNKLTSLRKQFDELKSQCKKLEQILGKLREENDQQKEDDELLQQKLDLNVVDEESYKQNAIDSKKRTEEAQWQLRQYQHIRDRLRADKICYQTRKLDLEQKLSKLQNDHQKLSNAKVKTQQITFQSEKTMNILEKHENEKFEKFSNQIRQFKIDIQNQQSINEKRYERDQLQKEIAEHAANDKDSQEKVWRKLFLVNKFLSQMLKDKMDREMNKFKVVEQAFQKIKQATGVSEAQEIINKFLTREQTYGELLASIAEFEKNIDNLKKQKEKHKQKLEELKQDLATLEGQKKKQKTGVKESEYLKKLELMDEKQKIIQLVREKLYQWCIKMLIKQDKIIDNKPQSTQNYQELYQRSQVIECLKVVCDRILEELDQADDTDINQVIANLNKSQFNFEYTQEDFTKRNTRIKAKIKREASSHSRNSSSKESKDLKNDSASKSDVLQESPMDSGKRNTELSDIDESENVNCLRNEIKRENDEVKKKKKFEEEKKKNLINKSKEETMKEAEKTTNKFQV